MQGHILAFRPSTGRGTIVTDGGESFSFDNGPAPQDLQGGDLVSFQSAASTTAREVRLVQRWSEQLTASERPLIRQLYTALQTTASSR